MSNQEKIQLLEQEKEKLTKKLARIRRRIEGLPAKIEQAPVHKEMKDENDKVYYLNMQVLLSKALRKTKKKKVNTVVAIKRIEDKIKTLQS